MDLDTRLAMLVSSRTVSSDVAYAVRKIIQRLDNNWHITLSDELGGSTIVMNLAMTLMRSGKAGINEVPCSADIELIKKSEVFPRAIEITEDCMKYAGVTISDAEKEFLESKLCPVLENN